MTMREEYRAYTRDTCAIFKAARFESTIVIHHPLLHTLSTIDEGQATGCIQY